MSGLVTTIRFIELSHAVEHGMVTYPGLPAPVIDEFMTREASRDRYEDAQFHIARIQMIANTGTYIDAPFHRFADGIDVSALPLHRLAFVEGVIIKASGFAEIGKEALGTASLANKAVLFNTGWSRHWGTPAYAVGNPYLNAAAAEELVHRGAAIVGIDSLNLDDASQRRRPAHTSLLRAGIPIVEHLCNLDQIPNGPFTFFAVPPPFVAVGTFPVRAFAAIIK